MVLTQSSNEKADAILSKADAILSIERDILESLINNMDKYLNENSDGCSYADIISMMAASFCMAITESDTFLNLPTNKKLSDVIIELLNREKRKKML